MKQLIIIILLILSSGLYSKDYKGEIYFKNSNSIYAKDINVHEDNITFRVGRKGMTDSIDKSKVDYLIVNDGSYFWGSFALGIGLGTAGYFYFTEQPNYRIPNLLLTVAATTLVSTLIGTLVRKKKRIDFYEDDDDIDISFINKVSVMPYANVVNYQLVTISVGLWL